MLFKKKKPKLDPKVRFQHKQFTSKLNTARTYRRQITAVPESQFDKVLAKIGLRTRWSQIAVGLVILGALYLVYVPNFLSLQTISITGVSDSQARDFEIAIRDEIASTPFYNPQRNLLFLSNELIRSAAVRVNSINHVASIKKDIGNQALVVDAESKYAKYLVATPEKVYDVFNDGTLKGEAGLARDGWEALENPQMTKVLLHQAIKGENNQLFFHWDLQAYLSQLLAELPKVEGQQVAYLTFREPQAKAVEPEIAPLTDDDALQDTPAEELVEPVEVPKEELPALELPFNSSEVHVVFYKNNDKRRTYRVIFDSTRDAASAINDFRLLLSQTAPDRYQQLSYIDMRLDTKAYVCLENSPCAK